MSKQLTIPEEKKNGVAKIQVQELATAPKETTLGELSVNVELAKKRERLTEVLSMQPPKAWIKEHPLVKVKNEKGELKPAQYLPIERVEALLRQIFQRFRIEVKDTKVIANAIAVTVRVHYLDPITGEWDYQDGTGATDIQTESGKPAMDFNYTKSGAVQKAFPAAKSYAVKDALEVLGQIFGGNLNRADQINFSSAYDNRKPLTAEQIEDAKRRAASGEADIVETLKKYCLVTPQQETDILSSLPQPE